MTSARCSCIGGITGDPHPKCLRCRMLSGKLVCIKYFTCRLCRNNDQSFWHRYMTSYNYHRRITLDDRRRRQHDKVMYDAGRIAFNNMFASPADKVVYRRYRRFSRKVPAETSTTVRSSRNDGDILSASTPAESTPTGTALGDVVDDCEPRPEVPRLRVNLVDCWSSDDGEQIADQFNSCNGSGSANTSHLDDADENDSDRTAETLHLDDADENLDHRSRPLTEATSFVDSPASPLADASDDANDAAVESPTSATDARAATGVIACNSVSAFGDSSRDSDVMESANEAANVAERQCYSELCDVTAALNSAVDRTERPDLDDSTDDVMFVCYEKGPARVAVSVLPKSEVADVPSETTAGDASLVASPPAACDDPFHLPDLPPEDPQVMMLSAEEWSYILKMRESVKSERPV